MWFSLANLEKQFMVVFNESNICIQIDILLYLLKIVTEFLDKNDWLIDWLIDHDIRIVS